MTEESGVYGVRCSRRGGLWGKVFEERGFMG